MTALLFAATGLLAGASQAGLLWRGVVRRSAGLGLLLRLGAVGAVLVGGALTGALLPAAAGWATGFLGGVALVLVRTRP